MFFEIIGLTAGISQKLYNITLLYVYDILDVANFSFPFTFNQNERVLKYGIFFYYFFKWKDVFKGFNSKKVSNNILFKIQYTLSEYKVLIVQW